MKIALDCRYLGKSGIGTYIENIVDEMLHYHLEHQYLLICEKDNIKQARENVRIFKTEIKPFSLKELFLFPVSEINKCDVFFTPYINVPGGINIPIYPTIHDCVFFDVDGLVSPFGKMVRKFFYKRAIRLSKKVFTVSEFSKERILHHFPTEREIIVTGNGISKAIENYQVGEIVKKDYFIYVGNIKKHKGLQTLIRAYAKARGQGLNTKLIIVGNNENFRSSDTELTKLIDSTPDIEFTGWVSNEKLIKLVSEAKALIQPSLYEGFGIPPLEALYLGTNAIISDIPVFKEIYSDLPVRFFLAGDVDLLCELLLHPFDNYIDPSVRGKLDVRFSYGKVTETILINIISK